MKRLYIAIGLILIALAVCITDQCTIKSAYTKTNAYIDSALTALENDDFDSTQKNCRELKEYWDKIYPFLTAMIDHDALDEAKLTINSLQKIEEEEADEMRTGLYSAKSQLSLIYDNQRVTFGNVF